MPGERAATGSFQALQQLARSFGERRGARREREVRALASELGSVAVPLLLRHVGGPDAPARTWAAELLQSIAERGDTLRARVVAELHRIAGSDRPDTAKFEAITLLAQLGEGSASATFQDPAEVHRRSLAELADLLTNRPDVALAADLLVTRLEGDALLDFVDGLLQSAPTRARHLVEELLVRTDLDTSTRGELVRVAAPLALIESEPLADAPRPRTRLSLLRSDAGRTIVLAMAARRCLCLLIDDDGLLAEGLYRDDAAPRAIADELIAPLLADGFVAQPARAAEVRALLIAAAQRTVAAARPLPSPYFLGRDLLDLGDEHRTGGGWTADVPTTLLARATDLLAAGEPERARPLLERCIDLVPADADAHAGLGLCLMACGDFESARRELERATRLDPAWPLHHWNLAAVAHRQGRMAACYLALRSFLTCAEAAPAVARDGDHAQRVALAQRFVADHERWVRLEHPGESPVRLAKAAERRVVTRPKRRRAATARLVKARRDPA